MINKIKNMRDVYFIIDMNELEFSRKKGSQFDKEIVNYVITNSTKCEKKGIYGVYFYKGK